MSQILQNVVLIFPKVSYWSGKAGTKHDEVDRSALPDIVSLGSKTIFDTKAINTLAKFRKRLERLGLKYGTKFEDGFMVPIENEADFYREYAPIEQEFLEAKVAFVDTFSVNAEAYIAQHQSHESMIRASLPDVAQVERSISMTARSYRVELNNGDIDENEVIAGVYHEVAATCRSIHDDCFVNREKSLTGKALKRRFSPVLNKLRSFAFTNSSMSKIIDSTSEYFTSIDDSDLPEHQLSMGKLLFNLLSHGDTIENICNSTWLPTFSTSTDDNDKSPAKTVTHSVTDDAYF